MADSTIDRYRCPKCNDKNITVTFIGSGSLRPGIEIVNVEPDCDSYAVRPGLAAWCRSCGHTDVAAVFIVDAPELDKYRELKLRDCFNLGPYLVANQDIVAAAIIIKALFTVKTHGVPGSVLAEHLSLMLAADKEQPVLAVKTKLLLAGLQQYAKENQDVIFDASFGAAEDEARLEDDKNHNKSREG